MENQPCPASQGLLFGLTSKLFFGMWLNTQKPKPHLCEGHCLADSQSMVTQLSNNTGTKSPGGLSAGLVACKKGDILHRAWIN